MRGTRTPGQAQRLGFTLAAMAATCLAGASALPAGGSTLPVLALTAIAVLVVALRSRGDTPLLAFVLVVVAWTAFVPAPSPWVVLGAAALVTAHVGVTVVDSTRDQSALPRAAVGRLVRRSVVVLAVTCVAALATVISYRAQDPTRLTAAVAGCLLLAGWVSWPSHRATDKPTEVR